MEGHKAEQGSQYDWDDGAQYLEPLIRSPCKRLTWRVEQKRCGRACREIEGVAFVEASACAGPEPEQGAKKMRDKPR